MRRLQDIRIPVRRKASMFRHRLSVPASVEKAGRIHREQRDFRFPWSVVLHEALAARRERVRIQRERTR